VPIVIPEVAVWNGCTSASSTAGTELQCTACVIAAAGVVCVDPMCGSGTLLIEAALIATNTAPGLIRDTRKYHLHP
jgi:hypothetical protein